MGNVVDIDTIRPKRVDVTARSRQLDVGAPAFWMAVTDPVRSKSNFRRGDRNWQLHRTFEQHLRALLKQHRPDSWVLPDPTITAVLQRPATVAVIWAAGLIDAGNISKTVHDAAETVLYVNDAEVRGCASYVERRRSQQWGVVAFAQLTPTATSRECAAMVSTLCDAVFDAVAENEPPPV